MVCYVVSGECLEDVGLGNCKDICNVVVVVVKVGGWSSVIVYCCVQGLYYIVENLLVCVDEFVCCIVFIMGVFVEVVWVEVDVVIKCFFSYGVWVDKYDGVVYQLFLCGVVLVMLEVIGVVGVVCLEEQLLLFFISLVVLLIVMGNCVVVVLSQQVVFVVIDFYQVFDILDLFGGVINIVIGKSVELFIVLVEYDEVDVLWVCGLVEFLVMVEWLFVGNFKCCFVDYGEVIDWYDVV